jgi:hypothetical protein
LAVLKIVQSEAELEVRFEPRLWSLVHDVPRLYEALLTNLAGCHLSASDLRPEATGSVGGASLSFWLFSFNVNVTIRLEGFSVRCSQLRQVSQDQLVACVEGITTALRQAAGGNFAVQGSTLAYTCHGEVEGLPVADLIGRFVSPGPVVAGFGANNGAGAAFYYGEAAPVVSSALTVDVSRVVSGGVFLRSVIAIAPVDSAAALIDLAVERVTATFTALDLQEASPWS